ncbi:MAG TPA: histidine kinase [Lachnospiraceae bacterium]|nr:histidine kinase [Lachnospiraceae bacterium]
MINLQNDLTDIKNSITYKNTTLFFDSSPSGKKSGYMAVSSASSKTDLYINLLIPTSAFTKNVAPMKKVIIGAFAVYLFIIPLLYFLFKREVVHPLHTLNDAHQQLVLGNEDYHIEVPALSSDFHYAYRSFNTMSDTLKRLRIENLNKELFAKQLHLDNLKLQIRPHFLLNTLNLLYTLIQDHQDVPAQELTLYLSKYFRYMFRNEEKLAMFDSELSLIKEYLKISAIHYPNEFQVSYQIDPVISYMRLPPLLLHNFFENIIQHSLIKGHVIHVVLFAEYENETVTIQISDDGRGMSPEEVQRINDKEFLSTNSGQHIGIRNSINRLKYYYGDDAGLSVESESGRGTTFTLTIPYNLEDV